MKKGRFLKKPKPLRSPHKVICASYAHKYMYIDVFIHINCYKEIYIYIYIDLSRCTYVAT